MCRNAWLASIWEPWACRSWCKQEDEGWCGSHDTLMRSRWLQAYRTWVFLPQFNANISVVVIRKPGLSADCILFLEVKRPYFLCWCWICLTGFRLTGWSCVCVELVKQSQEGMCIFYMVDMILLFHCKPVLLWFCLQYGRVWARKQRHELFFLDSMENNPWNA